jgi:hypothetical protein
MLGKTLEEALHIPSQETAVNLLREKLSSGHPLRHLGTSTDGGLPILSEEQRAAHIHILGTTREGKSKLLEQFIRHDIDNGYGATLLDPSDNGQTAYDILRYCQKIGCDKVCLIDPHDHYTAIPTINPLRWRGAAAVDSVVPNLMESMRLLWNQTSFEATPRIETYLPAVFAALYATGNPKSDKPMNCGISDAVCFSVKEHRLLEYRRRQIIDFLHPLDKHRLTLEQVFNPKGQQLFITEFQSSIRRLAPFFNYLPKLIYGSTESPLDFRKMIAEKWVILVNLDSARLWGTPEQRLLGTLIVNEIVAAVADLTANGWKGRHYLYIDEAGQFATRVLSKIMAFKGKSQLWATLSHQYYGQFEDKQVLEAVENLCKIKVMFYTPNVTDRQRMVKDMYTDELKKQASDAQFSLKKQHAVIKIGKEPPVTVRIADVPDVQVSKADLDAYKLKIYQSNPWYRTPEAIQEELNKRFAVSPITAGAAPKERRPAGSHINPQRATGEPSAESSAGPNPTKPKRKSVFDNLPDS